MWMPEAVRRVLDWHFLRALHHADRHRGFRADMGPLVLVILSAGIFPSGFAIGAPAVTIVIGTFMGRDDEAELLGGRGF